MAANTKLPKMASGQRYGRLTAVEFVGRGRRGYARWKAKCDCGNEIDAYANDLRTGNTRSCGCLVVEHAARMGSNTATHGMTNTPEFRSWLKMLNRCQNENADRYADYGGRGISVCDRWLEFENFYSDMGPRPLGKSLDRKDNDKNYDPSNCKWSTPKEQANNRRARTW